LRVGRQSTRELRLASRLARAGRRPDRAGVDPLLAAECAGHSSARRAGSVAAGQPVDPGGALTQPTYVVPGGPPAGRSAARLEQVQAVFAAAIGYPRHHSRVVGFGQTVRRHATRAGFRAFGAFDTTDALVGFSYGYTSQPGLWWREQIVPALSDEQRVH